SVDGFVHAVVEIDEGLGRPQPVAKLFPGHRLTRPLEQHRQNLKRLLLESELHAVLPQLAGSKIDLEHAETEADGCGALWHGIGDRSRVYHPTPFQNLAGEDLAQPFPFERLAGGPITQRLRIAIPLPSPPAARTF